MIFNVSQQEYARMMELASEAGVGTKGWNEIYWFGRLYGVFNNKIVDKLRELKKVEFRIHKDMSLVAFRFEDPDAPDKDVPAARPRRVLGDLLRK